MIYTQLFKLWIASQKHEQLLKSYHTTTYTYNKVSISARVDQSEGPYYLNGFLKPQSCNCNVQKAVNVIIRIDSNWIWAWTSYFQLSGSVETQNNQGVLLHDQFVCFFFVSAKIALFWHFIKMIKKIHFSPFILCSVGGEMDTMLVNLASCLENGCHNKNHSF